MKTRIFYLSFQKYHMDKIVLALPSANQPDPSKLSRQQCPSTLWPDTKHLFCLWLYQANSPPWFHAHSALFNVTNWPKNSSRVGRAFCIYHVFHTLPLLMSLLALYGQIAEVLPETSVFSSLQTSGLTWCCLLSDPGIRLGAWGQSMQRGWDENSIWWTG